MRKMFRRLVSVFLSIVFCVLFAASALAAGEMQQGSMYVNTANGKALRFRSSKSTSADNVLTEIPYGTKIYVLSWDGTWARIRYNSAVGYVVRKYLTIAKPGDYAEVSAQRAEEKAEKERQQELKKENSLLDRSRLKKVEAYDVTVLTGVRDLKASVYTKASLLANVTAEYAEGTRLTVQAQNRDWAKIYNGATDFTGYMLLENLVEDLTEEELLEDD